MKSCRICKLDEDQIKFDKNRRLCVNCRHNQVNIYRNKWRKTNKERASKVAQIYYINNKEKIDKRNIDYYFDNKDKVTTTRNKYKSKNRQKFIDKKRERVLNDKNFKLSINLRSRVNSAIKRVNSRKFSKTQELIGCTISFLRNHLESKFLPTMTWENYGKYWHIDHIIPCSKFDLTKEEEQRKCFNYTNLQPLFAVTQIIEGITYIGNINKNNKVL